MKHTKRLLALSFATLTSCSTVVPDVRVLSVSGRLQAGMDYAWSGHDETGAIDMAQAVKFLEAGALCMSSDDFKRLNTAVEQLCYRMGNLCDYETKKKIQETSARINNLKKR